MFRWLKLVSPADLFTFANGLIGFFAITYILDGRFMIAYALIFIALLCDGFDGCIARRFKSKHSIGRYLDSASDTISFCIAPAILIYESYYKKELGVASAFFDVQNFLTVLVSFLVLAFGVLRLARFSKSTYKLKNFLGIPTPATTSFVVVACILFGRNALISYQPFFVLSMVMPVAMFMIVDVEFPKLRASLPALSVGVLIIGFSSVGLYATYLARYSIFLNIIFVLSLCAFIALILYFIAGPFYCKLKENEREQF